MEEIWKDIDGYEGIYQASNLGRIKALKRNFVRKQSTDKDGYKTICLWKGGVQKTHKVHRLIAKTFIPNPDNKHFVNHVSGNKADNRASELEWCTQSENELHAYNTGLKVGQKGWEGKTNEMHCRSKKVIKMSLAGESLQEYPSLMEVKRSHGYSPACICECIKGKQKTAYGYKWRYAA